MGLTMGLVGEPLSAQPVVDRASFYISVSDRSKVSPVIYRPPRQPHNLLPRIYRLLDGRQVRSPATLAAGG
jgi:hypothetical protein